MKFLPILLPIISASFQAFDKTFQSLKFTTKLTDSQQKLYNPNPIFITHNVDHKYKCYQPKTPDKDQNQPDYQWESPYYLLEHLFKPDSECFVMPDGYWMYEICFGKHVRQFHEERSSKGNLNVKNYFLGKQPSLIRDGPINLPVKTTFYNKQEYKYFPVSYTNGDICDVNGQPRQIQVQITCDKDFAAFPSIVNIISFQESSSCNYEILVASGAICQHPLFYKESIPDEILCMASNEETPKFPESAATLNSKMFKKGEKMINHDFIIETKTVTPPKSFSQVKYGDPIKTADGKISGTVKTPTGTNPGKIDTNSINQKLAQTVESTVNKNLKELADKFFNGKFCLKGGSGWWHYEYCYGKSVVQFHEEYKNNKLVSRSDVILGKWDLDSHSEWAKVNLMLNKNKHNMKIVSSEMMMVNYNKVPKMPVYYKDYNEDKIAITVNFYSQGDICDLTGEPRKILVRHICSTTMSRINIQLHEPSTCNYILSVESNVFCNILQESDELGLTEILYENWEDYKEVKNKMEKFNKREEDLRREMDETVTRQEKVKLELDNIEKELEKQNEMIKDELDVEIQKLYKKGKNEEKSQMDGNDRDAEYGIKIVNGGPGSEHYNRYNDENYKTKLEPKIQTKPTINNQPTETQKLEKYQKHSEDFKVLTSQIEKIVSENSKQIEDISDVLTILGQEHGSLLKSFQDTITELFLIFPKEAQKLLDSWEDEFKNSDGNEKLDENLAENLEEMLLDDEQ